MKHPIIFSTAILLLFGCATTGRQAAEPKIMPYATVRSVYSFTHMLKGMIETRDYKGSLDYVWESVNKYGVSHVGVACFSFKTLACACGTYEPTPASRRALGKRLMAVMVWLLKQTTAGKAVDYEEAFYAGIETTDPNDFRFCFCGSAPPPSG